MCNEFFHLFNYILYATAGDIAKFNDENELSGK